MGEIPEGRMIPDALCKLTNEQKSLQPNSVEAQALSVIFAD